MLFVVCRFCFSKSLFKEYGSPIGCQIVWIQIRSYVLPGPCLGLNCLRLLYVGEIFLALRQAFRLQGVIRNYKRQNAMKFEHILFQNENKK